MLPFQGLYKLDIFYSIFFFWQARGEEVLSLLQLNYKLFFLTNFNLCLGSSQTAFFGTFILVSRIRKIFPSILISSTDFTNIYNRDKTSSKLSHWFGKIYISHLFAIERISYRYRSNRKSARTVFEITM